MIEKIDSLQFMKKQPDYSADIVYSDPPYGLGSEVIIRPDGKPDYKKAADFMSKWTMPTGDYWQAWFSEVCRTLKHGGYCVMFSIDRQEFLFIYYAILAGLVQRQSIFWYFISSFPKATDLSKQLDKNAGAEREVVGRNIRLGDKREYPKNIKNALDYQLGEDMGNITAPSTDLAKKYNGYKYSCAPLKQVCETVLIFQKPYKTGTALHDTLALEAGDKTIACGALNIEKGRVGVSKDDDNWRENSTLRNNTKNTECYGKFGEIKTQNLKATGRYPAQAFIDSGTAEKLDRQSGESKSVQALRGVLRKGYSVGCEYEKAGKETNTIRGHNDTGGCSKILHKCDYSKGEHDLFIYEPKVSGRERNGGMDGFIEKEGAVTNMQKNRGMPYRMENGAITNQKAEPVKRTNFHPTVKPIALNEKILTLFKTPNEQKILYPFAGVASEVIGGYKAGFKNFAGCEINEEYIKIGEARFEYWKDRPLDVIEKEQIIAPEQQELF